ncbi:MAG: PTS sugar transporter subunit IIA [Lentisphaerae bacterium]|nr:PTS sugar transporter subunit IIA [Lentisphaerota bacterium]
MHFTIQDMARLFDVSVKKIQQWLARGGLPSHVVDGRPLVHRAELLDWAISRKMDVPPALLKSPEPEKNPTPLPGLADSLEQGGVYYDMTAPDKDALLREIVNRLRLPEGTDRELLFRMLLAREALESTGVGDGIAIPHPRHPGSLPIEKPLVALYFLDPPIAFGALDGRPVFAVFPMISPTPRHHLHLLSRLFFALGQASFRDTLTRRAPAAEILAEARRVESQWRGKASS